jgi:pentatricopeptide repeat protein
VSDPFQREHGIIRRLVRAGRYVLTEHCLDEMITDGLRVDDIERVVTEGSIIRSGADSVGGRRKYVIFGRTTLDFEAEVIAAIRGQVVIITVYLL